MDGKNKIFSRIKTKTASEEIVQQVQSLIKEGKVLPGEQLPPERNLAEMLGVGRPTLREALNHLEAQGFIEIRKRKGIFIKNIGMPLISDPIRQIFKEDKEMLPYLYEVRRDIELSNAYLSAQRRTDQDLEAISAPLLRMEKAIAENCVSISEDIGFHMAIARATHNFLKVHILKHMFDISEEFLGSVLNRLGKDPTNFPAVVEQHYRVLEAIKRKDAEAARGEMQKHLGWVENQWRDIIDAS